LVDRVAACLRFESLHGLDRRVLGADPREKQRIAIYLF
jgi:hypothetical protein